MLLQLAAAVVVLLSVEHCKTTINSSEMEIYMYIGNLWSQLFVNKMKFTVWGSNPGRGDIFHTCPDWLLGPPRLLHILYWVSFQGVKATSVELNTHPYLVWRLKRCIKALFLRAFMACARVNFTFLYEFGGCGGQLLIARSILYPGFSVSGSLGLMCFHDSFIATHSGFTICIMYCRKMVTPENRWTLDLILRTM